MERKEISILIPCAKNSLEFYKIASKTLMLRAKEPDRIKFIISLNNNEENEYLSLDKDISPSKIVNVDISDLLKWGEMLERAHPGAGARTRSAIHERCVRQLLNNSDTPFVFLLDADTAIFKKNWDEYCLKSIHDQCILVGSCYSKHMAYKSKHHKNSISKKYQGCPNFIAAFINLELYRTLDVNMHLMESFSYFPPFYGATNDIQYLAEPYTTAILSEGRAKAFGLPPAQGLWVDVGADLPLKMSFKGYTWHGWRLEHLDKATFQPFNAESVSANTLITSPEGYYDGDELIMIHYKKHSLDNKNLEKWRRFVMDGLVDR